MASQKNQSCNPFIGKWKVLSLHGNVQGQGWTLFKIYGRKSFLWEFTEIKQIDFPSGDSIYEGKLIEVRTKKDREETTFAYYPDDQQLYIDRSDIDDDDFMNTCINDRYRVERINDKDLWIYDLEDVDNEPEDYRFRMKIRHIEM